MLPEWAVRRLLTAPGTVNVCRRAVIWGADGEVQVRCDAQKPCPYHDRNGLTADQRREWRRTWAMSVR